MSSKDYSYKEEEKSDRTILVLRQASKRNKKAIAAGCSLILAVPSRKRRNDVKSPASYTGGMFLAGLSSVLYLVFSYRPFED